MSLCEFLLNQNCKVIAVGRDESKISHLVNKFIKSLNFISIDLNAFDDYEKIFEKIFENEKLDGFVHCAGIEETLPLTIYSVDRIKKIFDINVFSGIELLRHFSKKKYSNDGASVVYLSSVMGELGQPGKIGYCSTKSAVLGLVRSSALEFAKRKFRVNAISPGVVNTPMSQKLFAEMEDSNIQRIKDMHPLGIGNLEDVTPMIAFLLSDYSRWITGQNIKIDGGYSIQ
ncbi:3-oxoacyl-[acyl-carrier-protein] reductase FabG [compost metagenome]